MTFKENSKVSEVLTFLREKKPEANTIYALFIIDNLEKFVSTVSLRDIVVASPESVMHDIMKKFIEYYWKIIEEESEEKPKINYSGVQAVGEASAQHF